MSKCRFRLHHWLFAIALSFFCQYSFGAYPDHTIRLVVPFVAGGSTDTLGRVLAQKLSEKLGQPIVVDNRPGAGGNIGTEYVARATPDGYTLILGTISTHGINPSLYRNIPFNAEKAFTPIALLISTPNLLVVPASLPVNSVADLVALAKAKPGKLSYASAGVGTSGHLQSELFKSVERLDMTHVPYRGSSQAVIGLISGDVQMAFDNVPFELPHIKAGKLRALAITAQHRSPLLPQVPTMSELGIHGFEFGAWYALLAPAGTPMPVVNELNRDINEILAMPDVQAKLPGTEVLGGTPQRAATFISSEVAKWKKVIDDIHLQAQ